MPLANYVNLCLFFICLVLCHGHRILIDDDYGDYYGDDDDSSPDMCAGGLGYYQHVGPISCCCEPCGSGPGPVKLPDQDHLDPDEDSCCPIGTTAEAEAQWGCCNCPDGLWIVRSNSSGDPGMDFGLSSSSKQRNYHLERESGREFKTSGRKNVANRGDDGI